MPSTRGPKLQDIAKEAGLSLTTVSRILAGRRTHEFRPETRDRVRALAEEMGWRPNTLVRGFQTGRTRTIGVVIAPFDDHWTGVFQGIHDTLLERGCVPIVLWPAVVPPPGFRSEPGPGGVREVELPPERPHGPVNAPAAGGRREIERINRLEDQRVDAILTWPLFEADARDRLALLDRRGWRIVHLGDRVPGCERATFVGTDEPQAVGLAWEHLAGLGHRRIRYAGSESVHSWARDRRAAFDAHAAAASGVDASSHVFPAAGLRAGVEALLLAEPRPTAVLAATDHDARVVAAAAGAAGLRVPGDLSITGFGNLSAAPGEPPLTTVYQSPFTLGRTAAEAAIADAPPADRRLPIAASLLVRGSSGPAGG